MTQSVTNTLNNLEQILSAKKDVQKCAKSVASGMDKSTDFKKVLDSTLNKEVSTIDNVKENLSDDLKKVVASNVENESFTIADVKEVISTDQKMTIASEDFKEILEKATDEANVETSLDLTLARDINEIISQLKEAVENATEIIEESKEESSDEVLVNDLIEAEETLTLELDAEVSTTDEKLKTEEQTPKTSFDQVLAFIDKSNKNVDLKPLQIELEDDAKTVSDTFEIVQNEVVEITENLADEVVVSKTAEENLTKESDLILEEELVKELKIESISAEADATGNEDLMQNQTPEEHAVKAMINAEIETFEIKQDSAQNVQNMQQVQSKPVDVNPSRILDQITKHLDGLQNNGKVNILLNPESLGKVNIQLLSTKEGLTAQFTVTTQEAKDMLTKGLDGLKESLGAHGVAVDNVSVKVADSQKSEYNQDWTEQDGSRGGNKRQGQPNRDEKEKGLFEKMMAQTTDNENGNV